MATSTIQAERTLLWTNPNPNSAFANTTLNINVLDYGFFEIEFNSIIFKYSARVGSQLAYSAEWTKRAGYREIYVNADGTVRIGNYLSDAGYGENNTILIPQKIYGIK